MCIAIEPGFIRASNGTPRECSESYKSAIAVMFTGMVITALVIRTLYTIQKTWDGNVWGQARVVWVTWQIMVNIPSGLDIKFPGPAHGFYLFLEGFPALTFDLVRACCKAACLQRHKQKLIRVLCHF